MRGVGRLLGRSRGRGPLALAAFIAIPLFFSSLMAATLALEKPHKIEWMRAGRIVATWHDPTTGNIASIWLWALVPPLLLVAIGFAATRVPFGSYIPPAAAIVIAMAVVHKTGTWEAHHTARYRNGVDLIPGGVAYAASNKYDPGQWEGTARDTALSLQHWTIGLSLAAIAVMGGLYVRRRYFSRKPVTVGTPLEAIHAPDATQPGLGETTR